jgi:hypothetical protein
VISYRSGSVSEDGVTGFIVDREEDANRAVRDRPRSQPLGNPTRALAGGGFCAGIAGGLVAGAVIGGVALSAYGFGPGYGYGYGYPGYGRHRGYAPATRRIRSLSVGRLHHRHSTIAADTRRPVTVLANSRIVRPAIA